jgi:hypothetical protein
MTKAKAPSKIAVPSRWKHKTNGAELGLGVPGWYTNPGPGLAYNLVDESLNKKAGPWIDLQSPAHTINFARHSI